MSREAVNHYDPPLDIESWGARILPKTAGDNAITVINEAAHSKPADEILDKLAEAQYGTQPEQKTLDPCELDPHGRCNNNYM